MKLSEQLKQHLGVDEKQFYKRAGFDLAVMPPTAYPCWTMEEIEEECLQRAMEMSEITVNGALAMWADAGEGAEAIPVIDETGQELIQGENNVNTEEARVEGIFSGICRARNAECILNQLSNAAWSSYGSGISADDKDVLNTKTDYMICEFGPGLICFEDSGQVITDAWDVLDKFISEEMFQKANNRWDIDEFKKVYGEDVFVRLKMAMMEAGIVEKESVCAFIATIGTESGYGQYKTEELTNNKPASDYYTTETRGTGLMQVTGPEQGLFVRWMCENGLETDAEKKKILEMLLEQFGVEGEVKEPTERAAEILGDLYGVETAVWNWAYFQKTGKESLNDFINRNAHKNSNIDNVFLASQLFINNPEGWSFERREKIGMEEDKDKYRIIPELPEEEAKKSVYETYSEEDKDKYEIVFVEEGTDGEPESHRGKVCLGWSQRYHDWCNLKEEW